MERSWDSSPQSLTTTQEQLTTFLALPSRSRTPTHTQSAKNEILNAGRDARPGAGL